MVYSARRREEGFASRESAGEDLWTESFDRRALHRLDALWEILESNDQYREGYEIHRLISQQLRLEGGHELSDFVGPGSLVSLGLIDPVLAADLLEVIWSLYPNVRSQFEAEVNRILREHRLAYKLLEGSIVSWKHDELHVGVVEPVLSLLVPSEFEASRASYMKALREISRNDAADAITDAAAALEEVLKTLGCQGNSLGSRLNDAKKRGLLAKHDSPLIAGLEKFIAWVGSERGEMGDSHGASTAVVADAWLMVHVTGAIIVRLVDPDGSRGSS